MIRGEAAQPHLSPLRRAVQWRYAGRGVDGANVVQRRTIGLMGGAVLSKATGSEIWSISNLHGDTNATLGSAGVVTGGRFGKSGRCGDGNATVSLLCATTV
jgi:hypothetical protein